MSGDTKGDDVVEQLREAYATSIRAAVADLPAHQALQLADTLCSVQLEVLAGLRVSYKARRVWDGEAITEDWRRGLTLAEIMKKHECSRAAAYKYHPGVPNKKAARR